MKKKKGCVLGDRVGVLKREKRKKKGGSYTVRYLHSTAIMPFSSFRRKTVRLNQNLEKEK